MLTLSGRLVMPGNTVSPTVHDIAVGLGRAARFGGQTRGWWSVLHHSFVTAKLMRLIARGQPSQVRAFFEAHGALHDAHECITADVPTPWKPDALREAQNALDTRIFRTLGLRPMDDDDRGRMLLKAIDTRALKAEAFVVGPEGLSDMIGAPDAEAVTVVKEIRQRYSRACHTIEPHGKGVIAYSSMVMQALDRVHTFERTGA